MTIDDIRTCEKDYLTPAVVAQILDCNPQGLRIAAREQPERLGFPVIVMKSRVKIPRLAFIRYFDGEAGEKNSPCRTGDPTRAAMIGQKDDRNEASLFYTSRVKKARGWGRV